VVTTEETFLRLAEMGHFDVIDFTHRGCHAYITYLISLGVMSASGGWFMGSLASISVMGLLDCYRDKYRDLSKIHSSFMSNEAYIRRVEQCKGRVLSASYSIKLMRY
jgi:hypothetical protein